MALSLVSMFIAVLVTACLPPQVQKQQEEIRALQNKIARQRLTFDGIQADSREDFDAAIKLFTMVIEAETEPQEKALSYWMRGRTYAHTFRFDHAIEDMETALSLNPSFAGSLIDRGATYGALGDYVRAFADFEAANRLDPKNPAAYRRRGEVYVRIGEYEKATTDFNQAIELRSVYPLAYLSRGSAQFQLGRFSAAVIDLSRAIEQEPENSVAALWLYLARKRNGQDGVIELRENARRLNLTIWPGPLVSFFLGETNMEMILDATRHPDLKIQNDRKCKAYFYLGQDQLLKGNLLDARRLFEAAIDTKMAQSIEYFGAREELKRLSH